MPIEKKDNQPPISREFIEKTFFKFFNFAKNIVGETKALEFALNSHQITERFYGHLAFIKLDENINLTFQKEQLGDREILGFSLWMQKYISDLKGFMVGIGRVDATEIAGQLKSVLEAAGFFEYFNQAEELKF